MAYSILSAMLFSGWLIRPIFCQLTVNVRNEGGDVLSETIEANTTQDTITLFFGEADGTLIYQFIDFKNEVQIFKAIVLGEEELGHSAYQVLCFVTHFTKNDFISSDAMSKLRQKNPSSIRNPEENKGREDIQMDMIVSPDQANAISSHIADICKESNGNIFTSDESLKSMSKSLGKDYGVLLGAAKTVPLYRIQRCQDIPLVDQWRPCLCHYEMCIGWYPCGLKYCKGKDSTGKVVNYRCGIKTCRKCRNFEYYIRQKNMCLWNDIEKLVDLKYASLQGQDDDDDIELEPPEAPSDEKQGLLDSPADGDHDQQDPVHNFEQN